MPTNPLAPHANASVDRLTLGVDSPRGANPAMPTSMCSCLCLDVEAAGALPCTPFCGCFEAEASAAAGVCGRCFCFESE